MAYSWLVTSSSGIYLELQHHMNRSSTASILPLSHNAHPRWLHGSFSFFPTTITRDPSQEVVFKVQTFLETTKGWLLLKVPIITITGTFERHLLS